MYLFDYSELVHLVKSPTIQASPQPQKQHKQGREEQPVQLAKLLLASSSPTCLLADIIPSSEQQ